VVASTTSATVVVVVMVVLLLPGGAVRGGRGTASSTSVSEPARPTSPASRPRSATDHVCTGFFLAAMIALKLG
jgi:hypothetical protein